jgi:hypothetical protein
MYYTVYEDTRLPVKSEEGDIVQFQTSTQTWEVVHTDNTMVDLDIHELESMMINQNDIYTIILLSVQREVSLARGYCGSTSSLKFSVIVFCITAPIPDKSTRGQRKHSFEANLDFAYIIPLFQF